MAYHGVKSKFTFAVATSIPQQASAIANDSRYTRAFTKNEGILIRAPLDSGLFPLRNGVYNGFTITLSEVKSSLYPKWVAAQAAGEFYPSDTITSLANAPWNKPYANPETKTLIDKTLFVTDKGRLLSRAYHEFSNETDGSLTIMMNAAGGLPISMGTGLASDDVKLRELFDSVEAQAYEYLYPVPYLWGSVIEGTESGARRFVVGPLFDYVSNPSFGNFSSSDQPLGNYGNIACSGTGPYGANVLKFITPVFGESLDYDRSRHDLFDYVSDVSVKVSKPINEDFYPDTPFSPKRLNYSGFRLRDRKPLPTPYDIADNEAIQSAIYGTQVEPERSTFGSAVSPNTSEAWHFQSTFLDTNRRHAFAITKRHVLGMFHPQHQHGWYRSYPMVRDSYGYSKGITGKTPFTDTASGIGDKIYFWDAANQRTITRTIIGSEPLDTYAIHDSINQFCLNAYGILASDLTALGEYVPGEAYNALTAIDRYAASATGSDPLGDTEECRDTSHQSPSGYLPFSYGLSASSAKLMNQYALDAHFRQMYINGDMGSNATINYKNLYSTPSITTTNGTFPFLTFDQSDFGIFPGPSGTTVGPQDIGSTGATSWTPPYKYFTPTSVIEARFETIRETRPSPITLSLGSLATNENGNPVSFSTTTPTNTSENPTNPDNTDGGVIDDGGEIDVSVPPIDADPTVYNQTVEQQYSYLPTAAQNAIKHYFPHGLNNVFHGSLNASDDTEKYLTWQYLLSHYKGILAAQCVVHLLDQDLPDGVSPIPFIDYRRSQQHKHEIFFDNSMRGYSTEKCPSRSLLAPFAYVGNPNYSNGTYSIGSYVREYANPYGTSTVGMVMMRRGRCGDDIQNLLDPCEEPKNSGSRIGTNCEWIVLELGLGEDTFPKGVMSGQGAGGGYPDVSLSDGCYRCWNESTWDTLSKKLPPNVVDSDRLHNVSKTYSAFTQGQLNGADSPAPLFTYYNGSPVFSGVMVTSNYRSIHATSRKMYEYSVTGHHGDSVINEGEFVYMNNDGTTAFSNSQTGTNYTNACRAFAYDKDKGRLSLTTDCFDYLSMLPSNDLKQRCGQSGGSSPSWGMNCSNLGPTGSANPSYPYSPGGTAYAYTVAYDMETQTSTTNRWFVLKHGGPSSFGNYVDGLGNLYRIHLSYYDYTGWLVEPNVFGRNTQCEFYNDGDNPTQTDPSSYSQLVKGTHQIGLFLSDQKVYSRSTNPNTTAPFYLGKVSDIFYNILRKLNQKYGVNQEYTCSKKVIKYNPELTEYDQPFSLPPTTISGKFPTIRPVIGVSTNEQEFLK